ncbi:hypothetical protein [Mucilaginibacter sp. UYCu711]|uniref:hypothetical protein n=1 Tax=Mucilaginibacter sp. UYCu711 TaxID=3156339 RepID=UPI003D1A3819
MIHAYLTKLGVPVKVQAYFEPYFRTDANGDLLFSYGDAAENYGLGFHKVPQSDGLWLAGDVDAINIRQVIIGHSAMDAIAFLSLHTHTFLNFDYLLFVATGSGLDTGQINYIRENLSCRSYAFIFGNDLLGRIADLKAATGIRRVPVAVTLLENAHLEVIFRNQQFYFDENSFSLSAFERSAGYRFGIRTYKPSTCLSFLEELTGRFFKT